VCSGLTGHAEVVAIDFDPALQSYGGLLELFWRIHDPTTIDRQGADVGSQYRSVIFYADEAQRSAALASMAAEQVRWEDPIVTELLPLPAFWPAEDYHQDYFDRHPNAGYCRAVIVPKLRKAGFRS
ncbi:MAG: peptide-methionine (S)-S-oxide reductase MsrA, partial [Spirochaetota bacterium]